MPAHAASSGRSAWWSWLVAVLALAALVVVVRPAMGHSELAGAGSPDPVLVAATPAVTPAVPAVRRAAPASPPSPSRPVVARAPSAADIPIAATGQLAVVPGRVGPAGPGRPLTYRLEIERGLPLDGPAVAAQVHGVLTDPRGWQPIEGVAFARTDGSASFQLIIASPALTDRLCYPLDTIGQLSCRNGDKVVLNARRWTTAVPWYAGRMADYRAYLVNHEVGHRLGHGHKTCPSPGAPAPVMVQQSKSLYGCTANPWPSVAY